MLRRISLFFPLIFLWTSTSFTSDLSISFEEFKKRLGSVFDDDQLTDLRSHLPADFDVWGYDVGDFSGDSVADLAVSVKPKGPRGKTVEVYFFVSGANGFLEASKLTVSYFEIPIEVAFTIEKGICFMTRKERNHHWFITGYRFHNGSFLLVDRFEVGRRQVGSDGKAEIGYEVYDNFQTLASSESFFNPANGKLFLGAKYYTFPVYRVSRKLLPEFVAAIEDTSGKYIISGKEDWQGPRDLSFSAKVVSDDSALYCYVSVTDDSLVIANDSLNSSDRIELWFDLRASRMNPSSGSAPNFRLQPDGDVMSITVSPGDFRTKRPRANIVLRKEPTELQQAGIKAISVTSTKTREGYALRIKLPYPLFNSMIAPQVLGFTLQVHDVDGPISGGTRTSVATSQLREWDPSTFGVLRFITDRAFYGEVRNLAIEALLTRIHEVGI
jgi:hypothetical protein